MPAEPALYETVDAFWAGVRAAGLRRVVVSPGLRSTPLAVGVWRRSDLHVDVILDERAAAFFALGVARASGDPVGLVCTSGTAGANYHPALIEAGLSRIPLVVITADRPPELQGWDAGQTIDQLDMFGRHAKEFYGMPVGPLPPARAERIGFRTVVTAVDRPGGPVHVNWPFREPLEPPWDRMPAERRSRLLPPEPLSFTDDLAAVESLTERRRGLIVAGPMDIDAAAAAALSRFSRATGWPIVADPLSQLRSLPVEAPVLDAGDHLFKVADLVDAMVPDVVVRVGATPTSKAFRLWVERTGPAHVILVDDQARWADASGVATAVVRAEPAALGEAAAPAPSDSTWTNWWVEANRRARQMVDAELERGPLLELAAARAVARATPAGQPIVAASSMPVRDLDMAMPAGGASRRVFANRGANGIDGTIATAAGVASTAGAATLLIGDLAFLHDLGGLVVAAAMHVDLTIVILNNGGGGIFSLLPIADAADPALFEGLYLTPQAADLGHAAAMVGAGLERVTEVDNLDATLAQTGGLRVIEIPVDRTAHVEQVRTIGARVREALL